MGPKKCRRCLVLLFYFQFLRLLNLKSMLTALQSRHSFRAWVKCSLRLRSFHAWKVQGREKKTGWGLIKPFSMAIAKLSIILNVFISCYYLLLNILRIYYHRKYYMYIYTKYQETVISCRI